jgi:HPt (histidine-containing phosphotransfer) domain-containing protein
VEAQLIDAILSNSENENQESSETAVNDPDKLYDLTMIRSVSGGDEAFIKKMILLFIETVPQNVKELVDATTSKNWEQVAKMAHKLKSTIDSMGIRSLHSQIRSVEQQAKNGERPEQMPEMVKQVELVVSDCIQQLRLMLKG